MTQAEFLKLWSNEASNTPGIPVDNISLISSPVAFGLNLQKAS
ncbi:MAG: hypothetical protein AB8B83_06040 [Bdellovibrionales bacterium]